MPRPPSMSAVTPGAVLAGRYRLGGVLGRGGMAEVFDGHDLRLERAVAIKLLKPEMAARDDIRTRFEVEARAAAGLSHPNAVAVFDTGEHDGVPFLVMERLPGETLADRIVAGPIDPAWLREAADGVLDALAQAHDAGIVHRDVKPGNILLTADGRAKIADFGIAKSSGGTHADLTGTGQLLGTPAYLAPERIDGMPATARSDLWALGVVLYEALTARKPFAGKTPIEVARAIAAGEHVPLGVARPDLDPALVATIERAMAQDPDARFPSARAMAASLREGGAGGADEVDATAPDHDGTLLLPLEPPTPIRRQRPEPQRWMAWVLIGLLVVLVLGVLARADNRDPSSTGAQSGPSTTAPATTAVPSPNQELAQRLRDAASRLDPSRDGVRAGDLAAGLRRVADALPRDSAAAGEAVAVITAAAGWNQAGQLTDAALVNAVELLGEVPGVSAQVTTGGTSSGSSSSSSSNSGSDGKGKDKDADDDD